MNNKEVAEAFATGATSGKSEHMFIEGSVIYSYGYHFPIAKRVIRLTGNEYHVTTRKYSVTTSRHTTLVRQALLGEVVIPDESL